MGVGIPALRPRRRAWSCPACVLRRASSHSACVLLAEEKWRETPFHRRVVVSSPRFSDSSVFLSNSPVDMNRPTPSNAWFEFNFTAACGRKRRTPSALPLLCVAGQLRWSRYQQHESSGFSRLYPPTQRRREQQLKRRPRRVPQRKRWRRLSCRPMCAGMLCGNKPQDQPWPPTPPSPTLWQTASTASSAVRRCSRLTRALPLSRLRRRPPTTRRRRGITSGSASNFRPRQ